MFSRLVLIVGTQTERSPFLIRDDPEYTILEGVKGVLRGATQAADAIFPEDRVAWGLYLVPEEEDQGEGHIYARGEIGRHGECLLVNMFNDFWDGVIDATFDYQLERGLLDDGNEY
jgi:hypothetical protein